MISWITSNCNRRALPSLRLRRGQTAENNGAVNGGRPSETKGAQWVLPCRHKSSPAIALLRLALPFRCASACGALGEAPATTPLLIERGFFGRASLRQVSRHTTITEMCAKTKVPAVIVCRGFVCLFLLSENWSYTYTICSQNISA